MIPTLGTPAANFPTVTVRIAFAPTGSGFLTLDDTTAGKLDTGKLAGDVWTDVTAYATEVEISRGSQRITGPTIRYDAGSCTVKLLNTDGRFDPTNMSGPYVGGGVTQVTPMRKIQVIATWQGVDYYLFTGFADSWDVDYSQTATLATVVATDATKVLGNFNGPAVASTGAGDTTGARINRILDNAQWPTSDRLVQTGNSTVQATTLAQPAWDEILLTADSENGQVYVNGVGWVLFRQRQDMLTNPRSTTSQATYGDGPGEIPYEAVNLVYDDTQLANYIRIARTGGTEQVAQDAASQTLNLVRTFVRTDLTLQNDSDCLDYASQILYQWKDPELRVSEFTVHPSALPSPPFAQILGHEFGDKVTIRRRPPARSGALVERPVFIRGVHHTITPLDWHTTFTCQSASKWTFFQLNDPALGVLDTGVLAS